MLYLISSLRKFKYFLLIPAIGLLGALFCLTPAAGWLEEELGLSALFKLRGEIAASDKIVIVSLDKASAETLNLPEDPEKWPRSYMADLIENINAFQPAVVGVNIHFEESRDPEIDQRLAKAVADGGNVILSSYLKQRPLSAGGSFSSFYSEEIIEPYDVFDRAAVAVAPFPLPKTASVKQFWIEKKSAGDIPTFPAIIFHCYVFEQAPEEMAQLLERIDPKIAKLLTDGDKTQFYRHHLMSLVRAMQEAFNQHGQRIDELGRWLQTAGFPAGKTALLNSWLNMMRDADSYYLNHYGKAGKILTVPFYRVLDGNVLDAGLLRNKVVLIGYADDVEPEQNRGLYTVFSDRTGAVISPVEVAATAVANLLENQWIKPLLPKHQFILLLGWGMALSLLLPLCTFRWALTAVAFLSASYALLAYELFANFCVWMPLVTPLILQAAVVAALATLFHYRRRAEEHENLQSTFSHYLPPDVVDTMVQHPAKALSHYGEITQGLCMATDAGQYTKISETMNPVKLADLMHKYYDVIFTQVKKHRGFVSDIVGDAMMAIWAKQEDSAAIRKNACHAALAVKNALDRFNRHQPHALPTRLSLHYGEMRLGNVGAVDHYEYRAVGDTVNTASRIERLNKLLDTRILVSAEVVHDLPEFFVREIGRFILQGKTREVQIFELIGYSGQIAEKDRRLALQFANALHSFKRFQWKQAQEAWQRLAQEFPDDGPTRFYLNYLQKNQHLQEQQKNSLPCAIINMGADMISS